ncbi:Integral membrane protein DUF6 [Chitinivibrio alkaliphilus ACht1]|uniref:Integral membrane protein DUF6 n=2 Tax=Chitinivibrio TaxID=1505231 RepID=U7DCC8_9BACT|nr:EamA family transporter [Chitinivibrio alkaliphilus]ERP39228.1 Integral membrane protein DUF6 [Chitinivibrio alkaliphilus ACht1]
MKSTILVVIAALFWGLSGGVAGLLTAYGWDATNIAFYRGAMGLVCVLIWLGIRPRNSGILRPRVWVWSAVAGLGVAGNFTFYFISIAEGSVAVAAALMYCAPVFVYLLSCILRLEHPTVKKTASLFCVILGILLLTGAYAVTPAEVTPRGVAAGLLSAGSYALFIFGFKYASPHASPQTILSIAFTVLTLLLFPVAHLSQTVPRDPTPHWPLFAFLGIFGAGLSFIIYIYGLRHTTPAVASIAAMVEPVTASLFGVFILSETLTVVQLVGMGMILITVTTIKSTPPKQTPRLVER